MTISNPWQPTLHGKLLSLRPLTEQDHDLLFAAASDPLIWEQHPDRERYLPERFDLYFRSGMESRGALAILDPASRRIIGSSRFTNHDPEKASVEIGYTFLTRAYWGGAHNRELKSLMLEHAFQFVETVHFVVGQNNQRSRKAMLKIGGTLLSGNGAIIDSRDPTAKVTYEIRKSPDTENAR